MIIIVLSALFILLPILSVILSGLTADFSRLLTERILWRAIATSGGIAFTAALIAVLIAYPLALAAIRLESKGALKQARIFEAPVELTLLLPPVLLGAGWFLILMPSASSVGYAPVLIVLINAIMALPFVYRSLAVSLRRLVAYEDPLCESLGIAGWSRFSLIDWPILKPAFRSA
jgi:thiamine transport system permease protein